MIDDTYNNGMALLIFATSIKGHSKLTRRGMNIYLKEDPAHSELLAPIEKSMDFRVEKPRC